MNPRDQEETQPGQPDGRDQQTQQRHWGHDQVESESEGVARKLRFCAVKRGATGRRESSFKKNTPLGKGEIRVRETTATKRPRTLKAS